MKKADKKPSEGEKKKQALEQALAQVGKAVWQGGGDAPGRTERAQCRGHPHRFAVAGPGRWASAGLPRGRIVEIYGPESSGKTTVALHVIAEAQKMGGEAAFIDAEHALDPVYAQALGVDIDSLLVSQPDTGEQGLEIAEALLRSGAIDVLVVDSVAALVPKMEIQGEMGESFVGLHARLMSQALRKLAGAIAKSNGVAIFINQLREKVGVVYGQS